jgi:hypothetical protein
VQYGDHPRQYFKIWHAAGNGPHAVLIHFHGGAFAFGSPGGGPLKGDMLKRGVTVVGATYRFRQDGATKREIMEDGARVVQHLRANAERFQIDPDRIAVSGFSAGGVVASWVALHDDLADPANPDPVLRKSSRVQVACLDAAQVHPLTLEDWVQYTGSDEGLLRRGVFSFTLLRLDGSLFRNPIARNDYETEEACQAALEAYRRDVFGFYLVTPDDPPVCFLCGKSDNPGIYARKKDGGGLHSPLLMIPLKRKLEEAAVPVLWGTKKPSVEFVTAALEL